MAASKWQNKFNWDKIKKDIDETRSKGKKDWTDDRLWQPDWKAAVAQGKMFIFRFLPDPEGNPFVKYYSHSFKYQKDSATKWYINNCISTFGWDPSCPVCAKNNEYYNSAFDSDKDIAKDRKRRVNFVSNVLVIDDPINPDNNGKVMLYRYGVKIYEKLEKMLFPSEADLQDPDFKPFIPFDLFEGANFKLKIKMQQKFPNYDDSEFSPQSAVANGDDAQIDKIMGATYKLEEFIDPAKYPSVDDTIRQIGHLLNMTVEGDGAETPAKKEEINPQDDDNPFSGREDTTVSDSESTPDEDPGTKETPQEEAGADASAEPDSSQAAGDGDDDDAFFANLK